MKASLSNTSSNEQTNKQNTMKLTRNGFFSTVLLECQIRQYEDMVSVENVSVTAGRDPLGAQSKMKGCVLAA